LSYVEEEIIKLRNINEELKSELNYEIEEKESLKEQFEEAKKNGEIMNHELKKKIEELEAEVDLLRK
jgi:predicted RNase H-like nuclease (RuvC/YqgF family)